MLNTNSKILNHSHDYIVPPINSIHKVQGASSYMLAVVAHMFLVPAPLNSLCLYQS